MTKVKFFEMLDQYIANHNEYASLDGSDKYTALQIESYVFHEDPCQLANYKLQDPKYPWTAHASGFTLAECWHVELMQHRTAEAAEKQHKIYTRWIAEYKAAKAAQEEKQPEVVITKDETKTTNYGGMWATDGIYDYSYDRCNSSVTRWEKGYGKAKASIAHKKLKWHNLDQDGLKGIIRTYDLIVTAALHNQWGDIRAFTY